MRLLLAILFLPLVAWGATTNTADSASYEDVAAACALSNDGDTVIIPAGTNTWESTLTIAGKGLRIIGSGTNSTVITRAGMAFHLTPTTNQLVRLSHFKLITGYYAGGNYPILIETHIGDTNAPITLRADHLWLEQGYGAIYVKGVNAWGVIDHCTFHNCDFAVHIEGGFSCWEFPIVPGTTNMLVIEDNLFITDEVSNAMNENIGTGHGERFVVRYNTFDGRPYGEKYPDATDYYAFDCHGKGGELGPGKPTLDTEYRGPPIFEFYLNTIYTHYTSAHIKDRGGSALIWSNSITSNHSSRGTGVILVEDQSTDGNWTNGWARIDQIENTFVWGNTFNGTPITADEVGIWDDVGEIHQGRDWFPYAPSNNSVIVTWPGATNWPGSHWPTATSNTVQAYYPYTPLVYPHPLVTAQDGMTARPLALRVGGRATLRSATIR